MRILFDLDGTLTEEESLPYIARRSGVTAPELACMTRDAVSGSPEDYEGNLRYRLSMLREVDVDSAREYVEEVSLRSLLRDFIIRNREVCGIVSSNLDCWWRGRLERELGCAVWLSEAEIVDGRVTGLRRLTDKKGIVESLRGEGELVVYVGDGANDVSAAESADIAVAVAFAGGRCRRLEEAAAYVARSERWLAEFMTTLVRRT